MRVIPERKSGIGRHYKPCKWCEVVFMPQSTTQMFCHDACRKASVSANRNVKIEAGECYHSPTLRKYLEEHFGYKCADCGCHEHNGKFIQLELDHIDGNPDNNLPSNLRLMCPNCHSQTDTFRRKNIDGPKSDRRSRSRRKMYNNAE